MTRFASILPERGPCFAFSLCSSFRCRCKQTLLDTKRPVSALSRITGTNQENIIANPVRFPGGFSPFLADSAAFTKAIARETMYHNAVCGDIRQIHGRK